MVDDGISIMYRQEVLGKAVWIKFPIDVVLSGGRKTQSYHFFKGTITKMEAYFPDNDVNKPVEYQHYVYFGDKDDGYYNLTEQEDSGYLTWSETEIEYDDHDEESSAEVDQPVTTAAANAATATPVAAAAAATSPRVVTPIKPSKKRQANDCSPPRKNARVKLEFGSVRSNIFDPSNDEINSDEFYHWLTNIHKGQRGGPISEANARSVMNRARDLISGQGISYVRWPANIRFHSGQSVSLQTDFEQLLATAKTYENRYGRDLGNGWLLQHPIKKMLLFKDYVQAKRNERANPELIE